MAARLSRISLVVEGEGGSESQGNLTAAAGGFGLFQTWLYATAFGTVGTPFDASVFELESVSWLPMPPVFFVSAVAINIVLIVLGVAAQRKLRWFIGKPLIIVASLVLAAGTLAVFMAREFGGLGGLGSPLSILVGLVLGTGGALLTLFWGAAFSRLSIASIAINAAFSTIGSIVLYACLVHLVPLGVNKWAIVALPLLQIPFALRAAPRSLAEAHCVPVFDVLPVKRGPFATRFVVSMLLFGLALGMLRSIAASMLLSDQDTSLQMIALILATIPAALLLIVMLRYDEEYRWDALLRPLMLIVGVTACVSPLLMGVASGLSLFLLFSGYLCFEVSMWVFFVGLAQDFRLSPVFLVGVGRGFLGLGSVLGMCLVAGSLPFINALPYGHGSVVVLVMLGIMAGYVAMPRFEAARDVARQVNAAVPGSGSDADAALSAERREREAMSREMDAQSEVAAAKGFGADGEGAATAATLRAGLQGLEGETRGLAGDMGDMGDAGDGGEEASSLGAGGTGVDAVREELSGGDTSLREGRYDDALKMACERIAGRYLLSQRQTEVLYLLARGHTAGYVQDKLCISLSTAKSHIYNIYKKLNIHKQHELLSMVEEEMESLR